MRYKILMLMLAIVLIGAVLISCETAPDLMPVKPYPQAAYPWCDRDEEGLYVHVKNVGTGDAGASTTRVVFTWSGGNDTATVATPAIPKGNTTKVGPFAIPALCWDMNCDFHITVDVNDQVTELFEDNNTADGVCLG